MVGRGLGNSPADDYQGPVREMIEEGFPSASTQVTLIPKPPQILKNPRPVKLAEPLKLTKKSETSKTLWLTIKA